VKRTRRRCRQAAIARTGGQMALARAGLANQQDRLRAFQITAFGQSAKACPCSDYEVLFALQVGHFKRPFWATSAIDLALQGHAAEGTA